MVKPCAVAGVTFVSSKTFQLQQRPNAVGVEKKKWEQSKISMQKPFAAVIIVGADTVGSIIGGGLGAAGGSFLGPVGTVGGWFGGTLVGGIKGSSYTATAIVIYDAFNDIIN